MHWRQNQEMRGPEPWDQRQHGLRLQHHWLILTSRTSGGKKRFGFLEYVPGGRVHQSRRVHSDDKVCKGMLEFFAFLPVSGPASRYSQFSIDDHGSLPCFLKLILHEAHSLAGRIRLFAVAENSKYRIVYVDECIRMCYSLCVV
jgi:hypothetical protein